MAENWPSEFIDLFRDRFLKLSTISITAPPEELQKQLESLSGELEESLERLSQSYRRKSFRTYGFLAFSFLFPFIALYLMAAGAISGVWLLLTLALMVGLPYFAIYFKWPRFLRVYEFWRRYGGARERLAFVKACLEHLLPDLVEDQTVQLQLHLEGIDISEDEFQRRLGVETTTVEFSGQWCRLHFRLKDHSSWILEVEKKIRVHQQLIQEGDSDVFRLRRTFSMAEVARLEVTLDEEYYDGFRQFLDREWRDKGHPLEICGVSASRYTLEVKAKQNLIGKGKASQTYVLLGSANAKHLYPQPVLQLMNFLKEHFLPKR